MNENKQELIDSIDELHNNINGLEAKSVFYAVCCLLLVISICMPKIYLASSIYYTSAQINQLLDSYRSLKEENLHLQKKVELLKYKNDIESCIAQ